MAESNTPYDDFCPQLDPQLAEDLLGENRGVWLAKRGCQFFNTIINISIISIIINQQEA